ncbi:MAG TPA: general secretion pathway protein GspB [Syntrophorhabdaceae bacterium]|nr:general secretion pathway protein GspB [Syntrophorhabdaceae bacterium]
MSYILEGLKKLEEQRQREGKPNLLAFRGQAAGVTKRRPLWLYLILAALILNAVVIVWLTHPWRPAERSVAVQHRVVGSRLSAMDKESKPAGEKQLPLEPVRPIQPHEAALQSPGVIGPKAHPAATHNGDMPQRPVTQAPSSELARTPRATANLPGETLSGGTSKETSQGALPRATPEATGALPPLKMSVHYYVSDPKSRFVRINDRIIHEGDELSDGVKMEEITEEGAVLSYHGRRFRMGINENR